MVPISRPVPSSIWITLSTGLATGTAERLIAKAAIATPVAAIAVTASTADNRLARGEQLGDQQAELSIAQHGDLR